MKLENMTKKDLISLVESLEGSNKELSNALGDTIRDGCDCDLVAGWICGIHKYESVLKEHSVSG